MSCGSPSVQMDEVRRRAQSILSSSGVAQDVRSDVQTIANMPVPLSEKYRHLAVETMLKENATGGSRQEVWESLSRLVKALSILEKYGCNLACPARPKYWRSVKHNNPVFRTTVDAVKGGRRVLFLYGYTNQQVDGLSFPDEVSEPDTDKVAAVTLEVMTLRTEVDMFVKGTHPHIELFKDVVPFIPQQQNVTVSEQVVVPSSDIQQDVNKPAPPKPAPRTHVAPPPKPAADSECNLCGSSSSLVCPSCNGQCFCDACDGLFHRHPSRASHKRDKIQKISEETCGLCGVSAVQSHCSTCVQRLCVNCDKIFHSHPDRKGHNRILLTLAKTSSPSLSTWECSYCTTVNEMRAVLCSTCDRPRLATATSSIQENSVSPPASANTEWECKSCTVVNQGSSILCEVCERPRLATRPPVLPMSSAGTRADAGTKWICQFCTFVNTKTTAACEMCNLPCNETPRDSALQSPQQTPPVSKDKPQPAVKPPQLTLRENVELQRQKVMREEGMDLIRHIREAETRGISPEEIYAALCARSGSSSSSSSDVDPCDWLSLELPHLLDEICAIAASVQLSYKAGDSGIHPIEADGVATGEGLKLSRAEAKQAWLAAGGDPDRAVTQLLRDRQAKMRELHSLGFKEVAQCEEALRQSAGEIKGALSLLQRPLLEPFHQRIWSDQREPSIDPNHQDKQRMCRRLLAQYNLPSWGRCELVLSLLQEPEISYSLEDVIQAVKESHDKEFIKRLLNNECPICACLFPRGKMQSLTSCQCYVCQECFARHFTYAVRDKHIRDMVCPVCGEPDINDPEQLDSYFSTLDIQLRVCLKTEVFDLFHKKLRDYALLKDPKFIWCCHCTFGFINDLNQLKVTCPHCNQSFCTQCKKPWEPQHQDLSCEQFQQWKRDNDPEYQKQGLAGYLRDNGITCPECGFQYALTKGGCMHFTCSQCRHQFCSGCNNPYHKTGCKTPQCSQPGMHAHHPRDCLFYLRDWDPRRLQTLLQECGVEFNTDPLNATQNAETCGVMEQKDVAGQQDSPCGLQTQPGQAGLCVKHYKEYLVSLLNAHSLDPARLYDTQELTRACERYQVTLQRADNEQDDVYYPRLRKKLMEFPLGERVPRNK